MLQASQVFALQPEGGDADFVIAGPGTFTGVWTTGLAGMQQVAVELRFLWGSSNGGSVKALLQTALGDDTPAFDVAQVSFAGAARTVVFELYGGTTAVVDPSAGGVDSTGNDVLPDGLVCHVLGDRLRLMVIVSGTYANTVLSARVLPK
jgi:hypothetical protein